METDSHSMNETKVLIAGLDGATFKVMKGWLDGKLKLISKLIKSGVHGDLETFYPTITPMEWICIYTGMNPSNLGIFGLGKISDSRRDIFNITTINASNIDYPSIWALLNKVKIRVGVVNIPVTYPPEKVDGFIISGLMTPRSARDFYYPPDIEEYLRGYKIDFDVRGPAGLPDREVNKKELLEEQYDMTERMVDTSISLIKKFNPSFFITNFKGVDIVQHLFWGKESILYDFYNYIDEQLSKIIDVFNPSQTFLISDHGFHEAEKEYFYINSWLEEMNYLVRSKSIGNQFYSKLFNFVFDISKSSSWIRTRIPDSFKMKAYMKYPRIQIDFERSKAFADKWGVYIADRMIDEVRFKSKLKKDLEDVTDSSGRKIFQEVIDRNTYLFGKDLTKFPDFITVPNPRYLINPIFSKHLIEPRIDRLYLKGQHNSDKYGIFIAQGDGIKRGVKINGIKIIDLAPTVLYLYKRVTKWMDGRILREIFDKAFIKKRSEKCLEYDEIQRLSRRRDEKLSEKAEEEVKDELRGLGYLD